MFWLCSLTYLTPLCLCLWRNGVKCRVAMFSVSQIQVAGHYWVVNCTMLLQFPLSARSAAAFHTCLLPNQEVWTILRRHCLHQNHLLLTVSPLSLPQVLQVTAMFVVVLLLVCLYPQTNSACSASTSSLFMVACHSMTDDSKAQVCSSLHHVSLSLSIV